MTEITWNETGSRLVETGISKGVLYSPDGTIVVPWNGLTAVTENGSRTASVYYVDGQKYLDTQIPTDYQATLEAFSYPPEFDAFNGIASYGGDTPIPGLLIYDQNPSQFHLSYQTKVGNDVDGLDHGYRIHVIFNVLAQLLSVHMKLFQILSRRLIFLGILHRHQNHLQVIEQRLILYLILIH